MPEIKEGRGNRRKDIGVTAIDGEERGELYFGICETEIVAKERSETFRVHFHAAIYNRTHCFSQAVFELNHSYFIKELMEDLGEKNHLNSSHKNL